MTPTKQYCSTPDELLTFLRGELSAREEADLQHHLNNCVSCRERLESTAADASVWNEAREFFANGALHASSIGSSDEYEEAHQGSRCIRQVIDSLGPTDDPESLGRISGYEVTGVVGAGGMGVVLKAHDRSLDRIVAIKVMSPHLASSGAARKRFAREAKAAAAVLHPNVIAIHSVASEDANPYLVMPFVRGASLQKRIDSHGPLPLKDTLRIGAQIAAGLAAAHEQGLVHRDIKPANILLEEGVERVTITDFGLARAVDDASMTCSGVIAGTPQYMSPEQARGEPIDARSDLFSLGGVLYAMCTGRSPFRAETTYGILHRIANDKPTSVCEVNTDVPIWLGHLIERLMAKRPEDRFESAAQVAELLEGCLAHLQQPAAMPLPEAVTALAPTKARRPPIGKFIVPTAFAFAIIFAAVLVVLELNKGTLTIQSDVDDIRVRITRGEEVVDELKVTKSAQSVRLTAGQYEVEVIGEADGLTVENGQVTLHRADTEVVKITYNTHDSDLPTYGDPGETVQAYQSNSGDPLSEAINEFNLLRTKYPLNDQPALTKDELIACASWNIEHNHELTERLYTALRKLAKQQWPDGWRIDGGYLDLPPDATPVRAYRISLVHAATGEVFTIRERFIEPPSAYSKPILNVSPEGTQLWAAIKRFNARYSQADGQKQPPLTENEVVAAIVHHQTKRDEADVSDALFEKFQQIARERYLPEETSLEVIPSFGVEGGSTYTIWSVRIKMFMDEEGKEGWTHAFEIREQFVSVKHRDAGEIHWGQPAENGLQAGVRLSPPLLSYELGQKIDVQVLYRNILTKSISATVPNFSGYEVDVLDANGTKMEVFDLEELIVGGARSAQIGNEPITCIGRSLAFAPAALGRDQREEYRSKTGASTLILVEPAKSYRLQFSVGNIAEEAVGTVKTGEVEITVADAKEIHAEPVLGATSEKANARPLGNNLSTTPESSPEYPPVKIVVHDEEGKPLEGVKVSLYQLAKDQGSRVLEINETSNASGMAVNRNLPYGHYELSATTSDGWYLTGYRSRLNVEFEKGVDVILVAPTPGKTSKLVIISDITTLPGNVSGLRFGELREGNFTLYAPEPDGSDSDKEREFSSFPTITNGIEHIGAEIRLAITRNISQPASSMQHLNSRWTWTPAQNCNVLIANGQVRNFEQGLNDGKSLERVPVDGSEFFKLPSPKYRVGVSLLNLREATELPVELDIPAGDVKVSIGRFLGKPSAAVMAALFLQPWDQQAEPWLEAKIDSNSAWVERLINTEWLNSPFRGGGVAAFPLLWREQVLQPGELLEIPLGMKRTQKEPNPLEARTLDDMTAFYNEQARQLRRDGIAEDSATADEAYQAVEKLLANPKMDWESTERCIATAATRMTSNIEFAEYVLDHFRRACAEGESKYQARRHSLAVLTRVFHAWGQSRWSTDPASIQQNSKPSEARPQKIRDFELSALESVVSYGHKATRSDIVDFVLAARALHHPDAKAFLQDVALNPQNPSADPYTPPVTNRTNTNLHVWRDNVGGTWPDARFAAAVGLAELGDQIAIEWLLDKAKPNDFGLDESINLASHERDRSGSLRESSRCALVDLFGQPKDSTVAQLSDWWKLNRVEVTPRMVQLKTDVEVRYATQQARILANARTVVEAYVASALAGDITQTAALAKNSPADPKRILELPEFLNVQRLKIETVYINDPAKPTRALATSVAVKLGEEHKNPDGRRDGFMVFTLELTDDKWFVIDIDFETDLGAEKELKEFLADHPNSIGIPPQSQSLSR